MSECRGTTIQTTTNLREAGNNVDDFESNCHAFAKAMSLTFARAVEVYCRNARERAEEQGETPEVPKLWLEWVMLSNKYLRHCLPVDLKTPPQSLIEEYHKLLEQDGSSLTQMDRAVANFVLSAAMVATRPAAKHFAGSDLDDWHIDP